MLTRERLKELMYYDPETGVFTWKCSPSKKIRIGAVAGCVLPTGYMVIGIDREVFLSHRLAWLYVHSEFPSETLQIDHRDGVRSNNKLGNLRCVTPKVNKQNQRNARVDSSSGIIGIRPCGSRWEARIVICGKRHYLGLFDTQEEAHSAYLNAKRKYHEGCTI